MFPLRKHITKTAKVNNIKSINVNMVGPELGREKQDILLQLLPAFCAASPDLELGATQLSGVH